MSSSLSHLLRSPQALNGRPFLRFCISSFWGWGIILWQRHIQCGGFHKYIFHPCTLVYCRFVFFCWKCSRCWARCNAQVWHTCQERLLKQTLFAYLHDVDSRPEGSLLHGCDLDNFQTNVCVSCHENSKNQTLYNENSCYISLTVVSNSRAFKKT